MLVRTNIVVSNLSVNSSDFNAIINLKILFVLRLTDYVTKYRGSWSLDWS